MSAKVYFLKFGSGDPRPNTGLAPTFLQFFDSTGATFASPSITEIKYGGATASGVYGFSYLIGISTINPIYFLAYAATTLAFANDAYVTGVLDPVLAVDQALGISTQNLGSTVLAIGNTILSLGSFNASFIGSTASSYGDTAVDPSTVFGYLKRLQEILEGNQIFTPQTGQWLIYNRTSLGTTTLLRTKTVINQSSQVTKTGL